MTLVPQLGAHPPKRSRDESEGLQDDEQYWKAEKIMNAT